jgi:hypothetical protein
VKSGGRRQLYKAIGAGLVLATWLLGAIWLDRKVSLRGEQQSADAYLFATTLTSTLNARLDALQAVLDYQQTLLERATGTGRAPETPSPEQLQAEFELGQLRDRLPPSSNSLLERAQAVMLQAATLPGRDSIGQQLGAIFEGTLRATLVLDSLRDSLGAGGGADRIRALTRSLDSADAVLARYEASVPVAAFDHRERLERQIWWIQGLMFVLYFAGSVLLIRSEFLD